MHYLQANKHVPIKTLCDMIIHVLQMYLRHKKQTNGYHCGIPTKQLANHALYTSYSGSPWFVKIHDDCFETRGPKI
jgi:hypothetical protein